MDSSQPPIDHALDGQSKVPEIIAVLIVCTVLSTGLVTLRSYSRAFISGGFGADDWALVAAQILAIGTSISVGLEQHYGLGRHLWTISDMVKYTQSFYASMLLYNASLVTVKISIVLMYRRIFVSPGMRRATLGALLFLVAWSVCVIVSLGMICVPIEKLWDDTVDGQCELFVPVFFATASINTATDLLIFALPLPAIWKLALPLKQKLIIALILCLGFFTCIISIIRLSTLDSATVSTDSSWDNTEAALWSVLEINIAIIAACLPTLRPLLGRLFPGLVSSQSHTRRMLGSGAQQHTWGGGGTGSSAVRQRQQPKASDSTDALYAENDIGLNPMERGDSPKTPSSIEAKTPGGGSIEAYKAAVAKRGDSAIIISKGRDGRQDGGGGGEARPFAGIRATTVIKQEYHKDM